jgi:hypothetical protein
VHRAAPVSRCESSAYALLPAGCGFSPRRAEPLRVWKAATSEADPRWKQDWILESQQVDRPSPHSCGPHSSLWVLQRGVSHGLDECMLSHDRRAHRRYAAAVDRERRALPASSGYGYDRSTSSSTRAHATDSSSSPYDRASDRMFHAHSGCVARPPPRPSAPAYRSPPAPVRVMHVRLQSRGSAPHRVVRPPPLPDGRLTEPHGLTPHAAG